MKPKDFENLDIFDSGDPINYVMDTTRYLLTRKDESKIQIELRLSLIDINKGNFEIFLYTNEGNDLNFIGRTGKLYCEKNKLNFEKSFLTDYYNSFETIDQDQIIQFRLYTDNDEFTMNIPLKNVMKADEQIFTTPIDGSKSLKKKNSKIKEGLLKISAYSIKTSYKNISINIKSKIDNNDLNQFYIIQRNIPASSLETKDFWVKCYKSEVLDVNNSTFTPAILNPNILFTNNREPVIRLEFYDYEKKELLGEIELEEKDIVEYEKHYSLSSSSSDNYQKQKNTDISITCEFIKKEGFKDYLEAGLQLCLIIGIDFTKSNGDQNTPGSLHYINKLNDTSVLSGRADQNLYQRALKDCGEIMILYDFDKLIPVYGIGGKMYHHFNTSYCFALNRNEANSSVEHLNGVLDVYSEALPTIKMEGPTYFFPIILKAIELAEKDKEKEILKKYHILMIFTDGIVNDMQDTIDAIVEASFLPISIIIIGLGENDFSLMDYLDSDEELLTDSFKRSALRDIVQFVEYNKFDSTSLVNKILRELPGQIEEYYRFKGIFQTNDIIEK